MEPKSQSTVTMLYPCLNCCNLQGLYSKWWDICENCNKYMISCENCGAINFLSNCKEEAESYIAQKEKIAYYMQDVYEANKNRLLCIKCSKPTIEKSTLTSTIKYCSCVEKLPRR
jgi:hypothetical protein